MEFINFSFLSLFITILLRKICSFILCHINAFMYSFINSTYLNYIYSS